MDRKLDEGKRTEEGGPNTKGRMERESKSLDSESFKYRAEDRNSPTAEWEDGGGRSLRPSQLCKGRL